MLLAEHFDAAFRGAIRGGESCRNTRPVRRYGSHWDESKHPRGQPNNPGQFASGSSGQSSRPDWKTIPVTGEDLDSFPIDPSDHDEISRRMTPEEHVQRFDHMIRREFELQLKALQMRKNLQPDADLNDLQNDWVASGQQEETQQKVMARWMDRFIAERMHEPRFAGGSDAVGTWGKDGDGHDTYRWPASSGDRWELSLGQSPDSVGARELTLDGPFGPNLSKSEYLSGLRHAAHATAALLQQSRPEAIAIYPSDSSEHRYYDAMVKALPPELGDYMALSQTSRGGRTTHYIIRKDAAPKILSRIKQRGGTERVLKFRRERFAAEMGRALERNRLTALVQAAVERYQRERYAEDFKESEHPRSSDGRFAHGQSRNKTQGQANRPTGSKRSIKSLAVLQGKPEVLVASIERSPGEITRDDAWKLGKSIRGSFENRDTGWNIPVYADAVRHSLGRHGFPLDAIPLIPQLVESSVLFATEEPDKESDAVAFHQMYAPLRIGDEMYLAKLTVKERANSDMTVEHRLYNISGKQKGPTTPAAAHPSPVSKEDNTVRDRPSHVSIDQLKDMVKQFFPEHVKENL